MDDYTTAINADNGAWAESECLGNWTVVKVRASTATLQTIAADAALRRLPKDRLDDSLDTLNNTQKTTLRNWIEGLGYPRAEWQADLGTDLGAITLRQVLVFVLKRRRLPRYDSTTDAIICDGEEVAPTPVSELDTAVQ